MKHFPKTTLFIALFSAAALNAGAAVITGTPTPAADAIQIPTANYFGSGPQSYSNYTWSSTNASNQGGSVFGYTGTYGFGSNGSWLGVGTLGPLIGLNDSTDAWASTDTMTFAFSTPVTEVGDFFNYVPGDSTPTVVSVYDTSDTLIESYDLTFLTGGGLNTGEWITFQETTPIGFLTLTDNYVSIADPYAPAGGSPTATPEPSSLILLGTGVAGLAGAMRRRFAKS